jgi:NADPH2:quinone reductase
MNAVQIRRFGGPEVLEFITRETPVPAPGEVLVRVRAIGINLADTLTREDRYAVTPELPVVLGNEAVGNIVALGSAVSGFALGARVAVPLFAIGALGGYADHIVVDANLAVPIPDGISFEQATALMVQGLTALSLVRHASPAGKTVLVQAAAGGVGSLLIQLAKRAGATSILAAASTDEKRAFARSLGADHGVDYTKPDWTTVVRAMTDGNGPDVIYESVGGEVLKASLEVLAPFGEIVVYGALSFPHVQIREPELLGLIFKNQSITGFAIPTFLTPATLKTGLAELFDLVLRGELSVTIGGTYPLAEVADAHRAIEGRHTTGKLVLVT